MYMKNTIKNTIFKKYRASLTVETALVLPIFMFFCIQFMSVISLLQVHSKIEAAMHQEVSQASLEAYAAGKILGEGNAVTDIISEALLCSKVVNRAGKDYLDRSMIVGGSSGIRPLLTNDSSDQDTIDLVLCYQVKPVVDIIGFSEFTMGNRMRMKKWTGYLLDHVAESTGEDELVYITENGSVYHKNRNCTHIMLSIQAVKTGSLEAYRNNSGEKYHSCENCGSKPGGTVFITDEGNRYHSSLSCSGLKRTVYVVKFSEAGGRPACSRCGA